MVVTGASENDEDEKSLRVVPVGAVAMHRADPVGIDLIQELRLRKWARENYVSPELRGKKWHPIVLEEMAYRDAELQAEGRDAPHSASPFVPLPPTEVRYVDEAHAAVPAPKVATQPQFSELFVG